MPNASLGNRASIVLSNPANNQHMGIPKQPTNPARNAFSAPSSPISAHQPTSTVILSSKPRSESDQHNPFLLRCPYMGCGHRMEAKDFYGHALKNHKSEVQTYSCPICPMLGFPSYKPTSSSNLLNHLQKYHGDMLFHHSSGKSEKSADEIVSEFDPSLIADDQDLPDILSLETAKQNVGGQYLEETLKSPRTGECEICFDEYRVGDVVARMDCFCVYHKKCIDAWLGRGHKCPLHKGD